MVTVVVIIAIALLLIGYVIPSLVPAQPARNILIILVAAVAIFSLLRFL